MTSVRQKRAKKIRSKKRIREKRQDIGCLMDPDNLEWRLVSDNTYLCVLVFACMTCYETISSIYYKSCKLLFILLRSKVVYKICNNLANYLMLLRGRLNIGLSIAPTITRVFKKYHHMSSHYIFNKVRTIIVWFLKVVNYSKGRGNLFTLTKHWPPLLKRRMKPNKTTYYIYNCKLIQGGTFLQTMPVPS